MMRTQATILARSNLKTWKMSECKHMRGKKQNLNETDLRIHQLGNCFTMGLWNCPLPCCVTCVQYFFFIVLISGPDRVRVIIKLNRLYIICNGAVWSYILIISARAVACTSSGSLYVYIQLSVCHSGSEWESGWARLTVNPSLPGGLPGRPEWLSVT